MRLRRLLAEPMLHFLVMGIALFTAYQCMAPDDSTGRRILVTQGVVDDLVTQHMAARGREPSPVELKNLIAAYVREEVLYREGVALGLERDDIVVKRRVRQKLEVMAEEAASSAPTDADLAAYLSAHQARFIQPAVLSFEQVFLGHAGSGPGVLLAVATVRDAVQRGVAPEALGARSMLQQRMVHVGADLVARDFGAEFAAALEKAPLGEWTGPIASSFGEHYVRVSSRMASSTPQLAEVRDQVMREWENARRKRARDDDYAKMRREYEVIVEAAVPVEEP